MRERRTSDAGHRTAKKAKIIYPPPRGVDIIILISSDIGGGGKILLTGSKIYQNKTWQL